MSIRDLRKDNLCEVQANRFPHNFVIVADSPELDDLTEREAKLGIMARGSEVSRELVVSKGGEALVGDGSGAWWWRKAGRIIHTWIQTY